LLRYHPSFLFPCAWFTRSSLLTLFQILVPSSLMSCIEKPSHQQTFAYPSCRQSRQERYHPYGIPNSQISPLLVGSPRQTCQKRRGCSTESTFPSVQWQVAQVSATLFLSTAPAVRQILPPREGASFVSGGVEEDQVRGNSMLKGRTRRFFGSFMNCFAATQTAIRV